MFGIAAAIVCSSFLIGAMTGCGAGTPPPAAAPLEEAAIFSSQLNVCVQVGTSSDSIDRCRAGVEKFWCGPGGALASTSGCEGYGKDGGSE